MNQRDSNRSKISQVEHWYVESMRLTSFPIKPSDEQDDVLWWKELVSRRPDVSRNIQQTRQIEGAFGKGKLVFAIQPVRIDWIYSISMNWGTDNGGISNLGSFSEALGKFKELIDRWLAMETCPDANRLAFAATLMRPIENIQDGYNILEQYLPNVNLEFEKDALDFIYQINRPIDSRSGITGLKVNRLANWSVANLILMESWINPVMQSPHILQTQKYFACRLELDINTAADYNDVLVRNKLPSIFDELISLGQAIADKGDIKNDFTD